MVGPEGRLTDRERARVQRLGVGVLALGAEERRQFADVLGDQEVVAAEGSLQDRQRPADQRLGLVVAALGAVELG